ncbi:MAG: hypothetical protein QOE15_3430 [Acidimicrobiaceae bacterium]|nr:hypothetical protein [Acidimicrobiaceae bacterium]
MVPAGFLRRVNRPLRIHTIQHTVKEVCVVSYFDPGHAKAQTTTMANCETGSRGLTVEPGEPSGPRHGADRLRVGGHGGWPTGPDLGIEVSVMAPIQVDIA